MEAVEQPDAADERRNRQVVRRSPLIWVFGRLERGGAVG